MASPAPVSSAPSALTGLAGGVLNAGVTATINNLFQTGLIKSEKNLVDTQAGLAVLSNQQQEALSLQLQNANNANDQLAIITNAIAQVDAAGASSTSRQKTTLLIVVMSGAFLLLVSSFLIKRSLSK